MIQVRNESKMIGDQSLRWLRLISFTKLLTLISLVNGQSFYQAQSSSSLLSVLNANKNIFNDRATILYRPQTSIVFNDGQDKPGECPITRPASNYDSFKQYEGIWYKRYRSRVRPDEPFFKCAWIDYEDQGRPEIFISDNLKNNQTDEWFRQNATTTVWSNDPTTWTSVMPSGANFDTHLIYFDGDLGVAVIYSCQAIPNGHRGIGNIYTRSPDTPLSQSYVDFLLDIFYQNGIYDVMPLHFVDQSNCLSQDRPSNRI
ncbi:allergen [Sarcoptes scabiei]|uniref:Uncharacterized protein n=1 Tax=Sarcoptes scabiei TaxID=52283 RepID=A0A834R6N8_SARSC|nr:allergen [Sarcoptes scabiei]